MMIPIGYNAQVESKEMEFILPPDSAPTKRSMKESAEGRRLYDATAGHKTRSVLVLKSNKIVLCSLQVETLGARANNPIPMMIPIGYGAECAREEIAFVFPPNSAPTKRIIKEAVEGRRLYDATAGHKTRSVIVFKSNKVLLCGLQVKTLAARINNPNTIEEKEDEM